MKSPALSEPAAGSESSGCRLIQTGIQEAASAPFLDESEQLKDPSVSAFQFELPVAPDYPSRAPRGSWEDGYRLSLMALEQVKDRPEIFARREDRRCFREFIL